MAVTKYLWNDITDTVAMEKDGAGNTTAVYQSDPVPFGRLRSMRRGGTTYNYHFDGRGNTTFLTDQTGKKSDAYTYDAFGTPRTATGSTENPYRYGGQHGYQYNAASDDYYVRARVYQPRRGRWRSQDPLRFVDGVNPYVYAANDPPTLTDSSGMLSIKPFGSSTIKACGAFSYPVRWALDRGESNGFIIQRVHMTFVIKHCTKNQWFYAKQCVPGSLPYAFTNNKNEAMMSKGYEYWEFWEVGGRNGATFISPDRTGVWPGKEPHDRYGIDVPALAMGSKSHITVKPLKMTGEAFFVKGRTPPLGWKKWRIPKRTDVRKRIRGQGAIGAGGLNSMCASQARGAIRIPKTHLKRDLFYSWNCCGCVPGGSFSLRVTGGANKFAPVDIKWPSSTSRANSPSSNSRAAITV